MDAMRRRLAAALAAGLVFYALSDILLWQRIFEGHDLFQFEYQYQSGHVTTLVGFIAVGVILLLDMKWWALWYAAAFYTLTFSGLEDVLYYWLDGRALPSSLPWLDQTGLILIHPVTAVTIVISAALWIAFWGGSLVAAPELRRRTARLLVRSSSLAR